MKYTAVVMIKQNDDENATTRMRRRECDDENATTKMRRRGYDDENATARMNEYFE